MNFDPEGAGDDSETDLNDVRNVDRFMGEEAQQKMQSNGSGSKSIFRPPIVICKFLTCILRSFVSYILLYLQVWFCVFSVTRRFIFFCACVLLQLLTNVVSFS